ncbi:RING finger protein 207-like [Daktulosphaira vitifoliae]|uniref:RING finger protein 207-like n=1 Tax=Daktulosphaira vitifoliae TaxID=58002 RepID=UPI0021A9C1E7|nr:RING finger protein 207-like [Daktulosphaira vitifoliae]
MNSSLNNEHVSLEKEIDACTVSSSRNPLLCFLCEDYYNDPCILICFHTFCAKCIKVRIQDNKINCPLCGTQTTLKDGTQLPPQDYLMVKLIEMVNIENPPCANCDKRDPSSMYFCSTCGQALCKSCRENTHRAKMFSKHDIVQMTKRLTEQTEVCSKHDEKITYFSNNQRHVICTSCVLEKPIESRKSCVDIDVAYNQNLKKLDRALLSVYDIQNSIREGVVACHTLLEELRQNTDTEKTTIHNFVQTLHEAINKIQTDMHLEVQRQYEIKERAFRNQLLTLSAVLPILQHHIILCRNFVSSSNKYYFLEIAYLMLDRLNTIVKIPQPTKPLLTSTVKTNYRSEFAQCLEPWFGKEEIQDSGIYESSKNLSILNAKSKDNLNFSQSTYPSKKQHSALKAKALEGEGPFSNHCRSFESQIKELGTQLCCVKDRLNELQREVKALQGTKSPAVPPLILRHQNIIKDCLRLNDTLERNRVELERLRSVFQTIWQEQLYRIHVEQDIFHSQMADIVTLQSEVKQLATLAQQLDPYVKRLTSKPSNNEITDLKILLDRLSSLQQSQRFSFGCPKMDSHCMSSSSLISETNYAKDNRPDTPVREKDQQILFIHKAQSTKSVLSHIVDKVCVRDKTCQEFRERSKSEGRIKECPVTRPKSKSVVEEECVKNTRACSLYQMIDIRGVQHLTAQSTSNIHEKDPNIELCDKLREYLKDHLKKKLNVEIFDEEAKGSRKIEKKPYDYYTEGFLGEVETISCEGSNVCKNQGIKVHKKNMSSNQETMVAPNAVTRKHRRYPHSDTEDCGITAMYQESSFKRISTPDDEKSARASNSVRCRSRKTNSVRKQRSWETFPTRKKSVIPEASKFCHDPESFRSQFNLNAFQDGIRKADSFEGHEEAVSSLVREFQKVRTLDRKSNKME